jgi:hypothetical protein
MENVFFGGHPIFFRTATCFSGWNIGIMEKPRAETMTIALPMSLLIEEGLYQTWSSIR